MNSLSSIIPIHVGSAPLIAAMIDRMGWVEQINSLFPGSEEKYKLSVGIRIKALLINILTKRQALYRVGEWYEKQDVELLLGKGITAHDLHDDALGRALDAIEQVGLDTVYMKVSAAALKMTQTPLEFVHFDTTTFSFYGTYEEEELQDEEKGLQIVPGYSKDHRPDLNQIHFGLGTVKGLPFYADIGDGNQSDKKWNLKVFKELKKFVSTEELTNMTYIADSAMVTEENLKEIAGLNLSFISRLPETFGLADSLKRSAFEKDKWIEVGSLSSKKEVCTYWIQSFRRELYNHRYRFIVVQSSRLQAAKEKKLQKKIAQEHRTWVRDAENETKKTYSCETDAKRALEEWQKNHKGIHNFEAHTVKEKMIPKRPQRGRPKKNELVPDPIPVYRNMIQILPPSEETLEELRRKESTFILITNIRDDARLSDEDALRAYKEQYQVEQRFRFLKSPYLVGSIYLHNKKRVKAFGYVMMMALLLYSVLERLIRKAMKKETEPLILPGKRKSFAPTALSILELLDTILIMKVQMQDQFLRILPDHTENQLGRILSLLEFEQDIYTKIGIMS